MEPLAAVLGPWHEFYALLGTASATMVGLLFVAATVGASVFGANRRAALRVFLSASVVNFSLTLAVSLIVLAPVRSWVLLGVMIVGCGLFGLVHSVLACIDTVRDGIIKRIDLEDRTWYIALPIVGYLCVVASGVILALGAREGRLDIVRPDLGCAALAVSAGILLVVGVHNAWDITVWSITRRQD
jgi:hypothetical protein